MMEIFRFFVERDIMFEATLLAERELAQNSQEEKDTSEEKEKNDANEGNEDTEVIDRMVEEESVAQNQIQLSNAEKFYLNCNLKNLKDIWNEFTFVDNSYFDFTKINSLLNQKSKNFFGLEKKKGFTMKCFSLIYSEETAF